MDIRLPKRMDGHQPDVLIESRQITIIGTNGAGKSRFCSALVDELGDKAYRISALKALFPSPASAKPLPGSIDDLFNRMNEANPQVKNIAETEFDKLFYVMLSDEVRELMNYKAHKLMGEQMEFPKTKLDITVKKWQEVFPKNKVLRENGKLMFTSVGYEDKYPLMGLSDGEKSVLYYIGAVLYAMPDAAILVDDPETFIHSSIMRTLWNVLEQMRPDCTFIYNTHDVSFASSRIDNQCVWVREFDPESMAWDYEVMTSSRDLDNALLDLLGSRKPVLFIEGDDKHSIDSRLYPLIFPSTPSSRWAAATRSSRRCAHLATCRTSISWKVAASWIVTAAASRRWNTCARRISWSPMSPRWRTSLCSRASSVRWLSTSAVTPTSSSPR